MARLGNALILLGLLSLGYAGLWELGTAPGQPATLPAPVALQRGSPQISEVAAAPPLQPMPRPVPPAIVDAAPVPAPAPSTLPLLVAADAADRAADVQVPPGYAVRLAIPAIKLDAPVRQGGIVNDRLGNPVWETLPFVAVHYGDLTALVGAAGNAVIAGHVVTVNQGNVFRTLYQVNLDDQIQVWDEHDREHDFHVVEIKLVPPTDTSPMAATLDRRLTLITCGGTFDAFKREFDKRLIVVARS
jgi:LPXTG-site transpeptidase (sortase) family protein